MRRYIFGIMVLFFIFSSVNVYGQSFEGTPNVDIEVTPVDPEPGDDVTFSLSSYEADLNLAKISWISGKNTLSGYGEKDFKVKTSGIEDEVISATANIELEDGTRIQKNLSVIAASYDVVWEAVNTKYPPFYMGKRVPIRENNIRVAVINSGNLPNQTSFVWKRNGSSIKGLGSSVKPYLDFKNSEIESKEQISVTVKTRDKEAERTIDIPFQNKKVLFYSFNPLTGLKTEHSLVDSIDTNDGTASIFAVPLGFNMFTKPGATWTLSGEEVFTQENPFLLSFGKPDGSGVVKISVKIENLRTFYQEFLGKIDLNF